MKKILILVLLTVGIFSSTIDEAKKLFDNKQYKEALVIFNDHQDDPESQYYLGKAYLYGMGVQKDIQKSAEYAKKSADKSFPAGLNLLGVLYMDGEGVDRNISKALRLYHKAAKLGNTLAMTNLGRNYHYGKDVDKDPNKAIFWYKKVIDNGDSNAYMDIGHLYRFSLQDQQNAMIWYKKAIKHGDFLGNRYSGDIYYDAKDYKKALKQYLDYENSNPKLNDKLTKTNYTSMLLRIGYMYIGGWGTKKNAMKGFAYFTKASDLGDPSAMISIGELYQTGEIVQQDYNTSIEWMQKSIDLGGLRGYSLIGDIYNFDLKDYTKALSFYHLYLEKTDNTDNSETIRVNTAIALIYEKHKEYKKAYQYFLAAAKFGNLGYVFHLYDLAFKLDEPNLKDKKREALVWLKKAANPKLNKDISSLHIAQKSLYMHYMASTFQFSKGINLATDAYKNGNLDLGCDLASYYGSALRYDDNKTQISITKNHLILLQKS